ncbi:MAG: hypothetical protein AAFQ80_00490 [Cyanobacteria bacterium J06621_8]
MSKQFKLFEAKAAYRVEQPQKLMSKEALLKWKSKIFDYQQRTLNTKTPQQTSLFAAPQSHCGIEQINPFQLKMHSSTFYRSQHQGEKICVYFIIDRTMPLLLYVGETLQTAKQRWNGVHDCRDYIMNYIEIHRKYDLEVQVCSAFWYDTPENRTGRLKLERELILRWQSPFNKENWHHYGKPFDKI